MKSSFTTFVLDWFDDAGLYAASITENGVTTQRTEYQDGWNAATIEIKKELLKMAKERDEQR